jgi:hypothetical protein
MFGNYVDTVVVACASIRLEKLNKITTLSPISGLWAKITVAKLWCQHQTALWGSLLLA